MTRLGLRSAAVCVLLVGIAFVQNPGLLVADTKFDLAVSPWSFLERALHLWDPQGAFGQLQNQAYGYLWPMGPFFGLGELLGIEEWVVQRSWLALVLVVAFVGASRLARALGVGSDLACLVAGLAYALSPRLLSTLGPISIEAWPSAVAPWVLLPLVWGARSGSPRRHALLAGLAVAMVGGVNAVATFAVIPLGVIWLLTRSPGPRRRSLMLWWPLFTLLGTAWWLVPLFVMGAYSPPFLDFIESASVTTFPTTPFDALRGTSAWVPYIDPTWQGGLETVRTGYLALNSGVLLMLGLVGMASRSNPHRLFLALSLATGLVLVTLGHQGSTEGWFAAVLNAQLDQALAPLRNVHKFDPVIRLPMVLGVAWLLDRAMQALSGTSLRNWWTAAPAPVVAMACLALVAVSLPAISGRLTTTRPVQETPGYWHETAAWLDQRQHAGEQGVALLAPGSSFGSYAWGEPRDEPLQYLSDSAWAVRNAIPLAPPGNIRMLDAIEERLVQGRPSSGLAAYLARAGVRYVVVRNDLSLDAQVPDPARVREALAGSPGLSLVETFGPVVGGRGFLRNDRGRLVVNGGWQTYRRAVEVYEVDGVVEPARAVAARRLPVVVGGPEDLLDLADLGMLAAEPTRLAVDVPADTVPSGPVVLTDGLLDRERFFGRLHDGYSAVRTPGDRSRSGNPTRDYALGEGTRWSTTARLDGALALRASSSMADANARGGARPGELPYAAVDGSLATSWVAGPEAESWWEVELEQPAVLDEVVVRLPTGRTGQVVVVSTAAGRSEPVPVEPGAKVAIAVPVGATTWIRVEDARGTNTRFALAEVDWSGRAVTRRLVLPRLPEGWASPDQVVLRALRDSRTGCVVVEGAPRCVADRTHTSEEPLDFGRVVTLPAESTYPLAVRALPRPGEALTALLQQDRLVTVAGSSTGPADSRAGPVSAIDGNRRTTWTAALTDGQPRLDLEWFGPRRISAIKFRRQLGAPVRRPVTVRLLWPAGSRIVQLGGDGRASFAPIRTDRLSIAVLEAENAVGIEPDGSRAALPVGVGELRLRGLPLLPARLSTTIRTWRCGTGPTVTVAGERLRTALQASPQALASMAPVPALPCERSSVTLDAGETVVEAVPSEVAVPDTIRLGAELPGSPVTPLRLGIVDAVERRIDPPADSEVVVARENANPGWQATQDGDPLTGVVVDGWQRGWFTDGSGEPVVATFAPDVAYRTALGAGGLALLALLGLLLLPARRWPGGHTPPLPARRAAWPVIGVVGIVTTGLLVGWIGAGSFVVLAALRWRLPGVARDVSTWLAGGLLLVASTAYLLRPWGSPDGWAGELAWPHYLVAAALSWALLACVERRPQPRRRMAGASTSRWRSSAATTETSSVSTNS